MDRRVIIQVNSGFFILFRVGLLSPLYRSYFYRPPKSVSPRSYSVVPLHLLSFCLKVKLL